MDGTTNSGDEGPSDTNMGRVWGRMAALSQLGARLGEATQQPGREECATECVARFCRAVWPRILDEQAYPSWEDNGEYGDVFCNVPLVGSAKATLRLVLTRYDKFGAHMTILIVRTGRVGRRLGAGRRRGPWRQLRWLVDLARLDVRRLDRVVHPPCLRVTPRVRLLQRGLCIPWEGLKRLADPLARLEGR